MITAYASQQDFDVLTGKDSGRPVASAEELSAIGEFLATFVAELSASGELVDAQGLAAPVLARRVELRDGAQVVTDGPFAETEEVLAGYWVVDCSGLDRATEVAARLNECPGPVFGRGTLVQPFLGDGDEIEH
ncbi:YciI family protein [Pseudonocardia kunmingensis]|nr:YciI family protein [Pseudonocardia kunmingensis]